MNTFAEELYHFAQSVDILTDDQVRNIRDIVYRFAHEKIGADTVEVCIETSVMGLPGLTYTWYPDATAPSSHTIRNSDDSYFGQTSYVYDNNICLWIVAAGQGRLEDCPQYRNLWPETNGNDDKIPVYIPYTKNLDIKTSIILPLRAGGRAMGVLNIEFVRYVTFYERLKYELEQIRSAIEILIAIEAASKSNRRNTQNAINRLSEMATDTQPVSEPSIFLAYPGKFDKEVLGVIEEVLHEVLPWVRKIDWQEIDKTGNITQQIISGITEATYGIVYFSEITEEGHFQDNANVLFEAGMFHALANKPDKEPKKWIPIREDGSPIPFNFASERMIVVKRDCSGKISRQSFANELTKKLSSMIK
jgi:hypothetical protein